MSPHIHNFLYYVRYIDACQYVNERFVSDDNFVKIYKRIIVNCSQQIEVEIINSLAGKINIKGLD